MKVLDKYKEAGVLTFTVRNGQAIADNPYAHPNGITPEEQSKFWKFQEDVIEVLPPLPTFGIPNGTVKIEDVEEEKQLQAIEWKTRIALVPKALRKEQEEEPDVAIQEYKMGSYTFPVQPEKMEVRKGEEEIVAGDLVSIVTGEKGTDSEVIFAPLPCYEKDGVLYVDLEGTPVELNLSKDIKVQPEKMEQTAEGIFDNYELHFTSHGMAYKEQDAIDAISQYKQMLLKEIPRILEGIDKDEVENEEGWWETSTGAKFGADKLNQLLNLINSKHDG